MNSDLLSSLMPLVVLFAIFYFLIIRPQQKDHKAMLEALGKGDKIVTNGGLIVEITKVEETFLTVKSVDGAALRVARTFIASKWEDA